MANKVAYSRRSREDPKWQEIKALVDKRDKRQCRFMRCLSLKEAHQFKCESPKTIDRAHIFAASSHPDKIYNINNIMSLQRFIHRRMDDFKSPLTGENIDLNEHYYWWTRIKTLSTDEYNPELDYESILRDLIQ